MKRHEWQRERDIEATKAVIKMWEQDEPPYGDEVTELIRRITSDYQLTNGTGILVLQQYITGFTKELLKEYDRNSRRISDG